MRKAEEEKEEEEEEGGEKKRRRGSKRLFLVHMEHCQDVLLSNDNIIMPIKRTDRVSEIPGREDHLA